MPCVTSTILQGQMENCISLTTSIFLIHMWPFLHVNLTLSRTYTSMGCRVFHKVCIMGECTINSFSILTKIALIISPYKILKMIQMDMVFFLNVIILIFD